MNSKVARAYSLCRGEIDTLRNPVVDQLSQIPFIHHLGLLHRGGVYHVSTQQGTFLFMTSLGTHFCIGTRSLKCSPPSRGARSSKHYCNSAEPLPRGEDFIWHSANTFQRFIAENILLRMEDAASAQPQEMSDGGLGSWNPAWRPDSNAYTANHADSENTQEGIEDHTLRDEHSSLPHNTSSISLQPQALYPEDMHREAPEHQVDPQRSLSTDDTGISTSSPSKTIQGSAQPEAKPSPSDLALDVMDNSSGKKGHDSDSSLKSDTIGGLQLDQHVPPKVEEGAHSVTVDATGNINWGEKDLDPAWGLAPAYNSPDNPKSMKHTNSFPQVPPLQTATGGRPPHSLPHSQVEDIMEEMEEIEEFEKTTGADNIRNDFPSKVLSHPDPFQDDADAYAQDSFFAKVNGIEDHAASTPADEEARFEEGLPLMPSDSPRPISMTSSSQVPSDPLFAFVGRSNDVDEDFFANMAPSHQDDPSSPKPHPLDRKSTSQVLDSMQFHPGSEDHALPTGGEQRKSIESQAGHGSAASASSVIPQILANHTTSEEQATTYKPSERVNNEDEDLAAMWQAALADDELLDEDEASLDPTSFFEDDGEGFLEENVSESQLDRPDQISPISQPGIGLDDPVQGFGNTSTADHRFGSSVISSQSRYALQQQHSTGVFAAQPSPYVPAGISNPLSAPSIVANRLGHPSPYGAPEPIQRPGLPDKTQSFADKSKGGYTSPYDLPMEVTRPKRRINSQHTPNINLHTPSNVPRPPPRSSSSMYSNTTSPPATATIQPPSSALHSPVAPSTATSTAPTLTAPAPTLKAKPSKGSFFEELPIVAKQRPSTSAGRFVPPATRATPPPPQMSLQRAQTEQYPANHQQLQPPSSSATSQGYQLLPPQRVLPYANTAQQGIDNQPVPAASTRYSPAPPAQPNVPLNRNRYATPPTGPPRPPSISQMLPFQPRTSSPLAQSVPAPQQYRQSAGPSGPSTLLENSSSHDIKPRPREFHFEQPLIHPPENSYPTVTNSTSMPQYGTHQASAEPLPPKRALSYNQPLDQPQSQIPSTLNPPVRSRTQSPSALMPRPYAPMDSAFQYQRSASANEPLSPTFPSVAHNTSYPAPATNPRSNERGFPRNLNYITPTDGRELDPLERWKGCPIFTFGFGGNIVTSFPKQVPLYGVGQAIPSLKCSPGEVHLRSGKIIPFEEQITTFPGPLKAKNKKKEVLDWLAKVIQQFEQHHIPLSPAQNLPDPRKRHEEKILLWKFMRILVEHDGAIEGNLAAEKAVRTVLSPELAFDSSQHPLSYDSSSQLRGISRSSGSKSNIDPVDPAAVESLRKSLLEGEREKAVWHAVDQRLWGHAMLISSTLSRDIWKQVAQEFVRHEVRTFGNNTESLAALYDIFAGNWEESIDELVPPSARAGLQMVSKVAGSGPTKNALDGLDRWQETLSLVLGNRSPEDSKALVALGRLLSSYGRAEAAHICYILAKTPGLFGGPDDPQVSVALLGADHLQQPSDYSRDLDSILLTEVYEFALTVLAPSGISAVPPHLQAYKLYHAMILADCGFRNEAQQYCDAITNTLKATTKLSPYYHTLLFSVLDDLTSRLRQAPKDSSSSWIPKPSIDKVSGSVWARFNQFVAGDESDSASTGSGKGLESETGPFANVSGETPSISRTPSAGDLYGSYLGGGGVTPGLQSTTSNSRYAPGGLYTPRSSLEQPRRSSQESQRPSHIDTLKRSNLQRQSSYQSLPSFSPDLLRKPLPDALNLASRPSTATYPHNSESYLPTPPIQPQYLPEAPFEDMSGPQYQPDNYQPTPPPARTKSYSPHQQSSIPLLDSSHARSLNAHSPRINAYAPQPEIYEPMSLRDDSFLSSQEPPLNTYEPPSTSYEPPSSLSAYEPPSTDSYTPPSYDPETRSSEQSPVQEKPKKSFMDNDEDEDLIARAAALAKQERDRKDRETDEAFRKAAEADGNP